MARTRSPCRRRNGEERTTESPSSAAARSSPMRESVLRASRSTARERSTSPSRMLSEAARSRADIFRTITAACSRGRRSGARGTAVAATSATAPPISASVQRTNAAPGDGNRVLTTIAWIAAWLTNNVPWSRSSAVTIANDTISAICQPPEPSQ